MMIRRWRRALALAVVTAAVAAGVLLATRPWSGDEAAGGTIHWRMCDTVLEAPLPQAPQGARDILVIARTVDNNGLNPSLKIQVRLPSEGSDPSEVSIDPTTGAVTAEVYATAANEVQISTVLDTLRVEPLDRATAPWPYTDARQLSFKRVNRTTFGYAGPDPASGIVVSMIRGSGGYGVSHALQVANCESVMYIIAEFDDEGNPTVSVDKKKVSADDKAAFETFLEEVSVRGLGQP